MRSMRILTAAALTAACVAIATVENTHVQMRHTDSVSSAVRRSDSAMGTSRLLAMLWPCGPMCV